MSIFSPRGYGFDIGAPQLGVRIIESEAMTETIEDWTRVRSPGRARRRMKRGHRQNVAYHTVPRRGVVSIDGGRTLIVHPAFMREIGKQLASRLERQMDRLFAEAVLGGHETPAMEADRITRELFERLRKGGKG